MAKVQSSARIEFSATLTLTEGECIALDALIGYGFEPFLKTFRDHLGTAYLQGHEKDLKSAFEAISRDVLPALQDIRQARSDLIEAAKKRAVDREAAQASEDAQ